MKEKRITETYRGRSPIVALLLALSLLAYGCSEAAESTGSTGPSPAAEQNDTSDTSGDSDSSGIDPDVQEAYDGFVTEEIPGLDVAILQAAKDEGSVVYYTGYTGDAQAALFQEVLPFIDLEIVQLTIPQLSERIATEREAGIHEIDVINNGKTALIPLMDDYSVCEEYTPTSAEDFSPAGITREGYAYNTAGVIYGFAFIPARTPPELISDLRTWEGAFESSNWDGVQLGVVDAPPGSSTHYTFVALDHNGVGPEMWATQVDTVGGHNIYGGTSAVSQSLLLGEVDVGGPLGLGAPADLYAAGAPIGWVAPEPHIAAPITACVASEAPHPNAAQVFYEFLLSDAAQLAGLPASVSFKRGLDVEAAMPPALLEEPWFVVPGEEFWEVGLEEETLVAEDLKAEWNSIYAP